MTPLANATGLRHPVAGRFDEGAEPMRLHRHGRFFLALAIGVAGAAAVPSAVELRSIVGANLFSAVYLALMLHFAATTTPDGLRRHAAEADEGVAVILAIALAVVVLSLAVVFLTFAADTAASTWKVGLALLGLPLGWLMLQTVTAFHYARLFYGRTDQGGDAGGLRFEATAEPGAWEFLYLAFTVGMTAQVSDTVVTTTAMRRTTLVHAVLSFFYNTVILALAVNATVSLGR